MIIKELQRLFCNSFYLCKICTKIIVLFIKLSIASEKETSYKKDYKYELNSYCTFLKLPGYLYGEGDCKDNEDSGTF